MHLTRPPPRSPSCLCGCCLSSCVQHMGDGVGCKHFNAKSSLSSRVNCRVLSLHCKYEALWAGFVVQAREAKRTHVSIVLTRKCCSSRLGSAPLTGAAGGCTQGHAGFAAAGSLACLGWRKVSAMPSSPC